MYALDNSRASVVQQQMRHTEADRVHGSVLNIAMVKRRLMWHYVTHRGVIRNHCSRDNAVVCHSGMIVIGV